MRLWFGGIGFWGLKQSAPVFILNPPGRAGQSGHGAERDAHSSPVAGKQAATGGEPGVRVERK